MLENSPLLKQFNALDRLNFSGCQVFAYVQIRI